MREVGARKSLTEGEVVDRGPGVSHPASSCPCQACLTYTLTIHPASSILACLTFLNSILLGVFFLTPFLCTYPLIPSASHNTPPLPPPPLALLPMLSAPFQSPLGIDGRSNLFQRGLHLILTKTVLLVFISTT